MFTINRRLIIELAAFGVFLAVVAYILYALGLIDFFTARQRLIAFIQEHRAYAVFLFIGLQIVQVVARPSPAR